MIGLTKRAIIAIIGTAAAVALAVGLAGVVSLLSGWKSARTVQVNADCLRMLREFTGYPVLYPGENVFGLPLTMCDRYQTPAVYDATGGLVEPATDSLALIYGACQPEPEAGCPPPVQVIIEPPCGPGILHESQKVETVRVRGVDAFVKPDGSIRIESDQFRVSLFALVDPDGGPGKQRQHALRLAELLRGANDQASRIGVETSLDVRLENAQPCG